MSLQEQLARIEKLLRERKDTDPGAQKAWEAVTVLCQYRLMTTKACPPECVNEEFHIHSIWIHREVCPTCHSTGRMVRTISNSDWPEGAVRGLLEYDVAWALGWTTDFWLVSQSGPLWRCQLKGVT